MVLTAIIYMGTFCKRLTIASAIKKNLQLNGFNVIIRCWTTSNNPLDYTNVKKFNIHKGSFDLVIGHSAGGFPLAFTKLKKGGKKLGINPFFTQYLFCDTVFHADKDWLSPQDWDPKRNVIEYKGEHNTFPRFLFEDYLIENFLDKS